MIALHKLDDEEKGGIPFRMLPSFGRSHLLLPCLLLDAAYDFLCTVTDRIICDTRAQTQYDMILIYRLVKAKCRDIKHRYTLDIVCLASLCQIFE